MNDQPSTVFMTHAEDDEPGRVYFDRLFGSSRIRANWCPYTEGRTYPHLHGIRRAIESSSSLFVVLSRALESNGHTRYWISFEAGIAVGMNRPVWVFEPASEEIDVPVPGAWDYLYRRALTETVKTFQFERIVKSAGTEYPIADSDEWFSEHLQ
jgi:hypothetical protein